MNIEQDLFNSTYSTTQIAKELPLFDNANQLNYILKTKYLLLHNGNLSQYSINNELAIIFQGINKKGESYSQIRWTIKGKKYIENIVNQNQFTQTNQKIIKKIEVKYSYINNDIDNLIQIIVCTIENDDRHYYELNQQINLNANINNLIDKMKTKGTINIKYWSYKDIADYNKYDSDLNNKQKTTTIKDKFKSYKEYATKAKKYFEDNFEKIKILFENTTIRDIVFEPFIEVFKAPKNSIDKDIYLVITQVAIINVVLAGLPGKMGIGVWVSIALEAWMAYSIAKHIGIKLNKPSDVFKYFGILSATLGIILFGFKGLLSFGFSLFSVIPEVNPLMIAELMVTDFVGILFWIGFSEAKNSGSFTIPKKMFFKIFKITKELFSYQFNILKKLLTPSNIKLFGTRLKQWSTGDFIGDRKVLNGELFSTLAMSHLISGNYEKLQGPLGDIFIESIRLRWSNKVPEDATIEDISQIFREYSNEQLIGVTNTIKGKMFELMVANTENTDNDNWTAELFIDESHADSDIIFTNPTTGEILEVSLKATSTKGIIEEALIKYPDTPIMTTDEIAKLYQNDDRVFGSGFSNDELNIETKEMLDKLRSDMKPAHSADEIALGGVAIGTMATIWPFAMAYFRKKITYEEFENILKYLIPDTGVTLASRISYALLFGPLFAWYLLARGVGKVVVGIDGLRPESKHIQFTSNPNKTSYNNK
jgi:hypothetical protein